MSPYLATATNGTFLTDRYRANGVFMYDAVDPNTRVEEADPPNRRSPSSPLDPQAPEIMAFFSDLYGGYPFSAGGGIIDWAPDVGYALESQTRTNYERIPDATTVVHEIAHQWFGDAVTLAGGPTSGSTRVLRRSRSGSTFSRESEANDTKSTLSASRTPLRRSLRGGLGTRGG